MYTPVEEVRGGVSAAFALRPRSKVKSANSTGKHGWARKGMALLDPALAPVPIWEFSAEILVLHHSTTLSCGYSPIMHIGVCSQAARVTKITNLDGAPLASLRTADRAIISCRFMHHPEHIHVGDALLFREGRAKGVGRVKDIKT
jgi:GTPase